MGEFICEAGENLEIWRVKLDEITEQNVNARTMPPETLERLAENIKKEGRLESLPFCVKRGENKFELLSGHHRTRAARMAEIEEMLVIADTRDLNRSQVVAKQLAHNSITGRDDRELLRTLYAEMADVNDLLESYIRPEDLQFENKEKPLDLTDVSLDLPWKTMSLVFLTEGMEKFDDVCAAISTDTDTVGVVSIDLFERFQKALTEVGKIEDIRLIGAIFARMLEIIEEFVKREEEKKKESPPQGFEP